jgi:hypothetical protein
VRVNGYSHRVAGSILKMIEKSFAHAFKQNENGKVSIKISEPSTDKL